MPNYLCTLVRSFTVEIQAMNRKEAAELAEYFIGYSDDSSEEDRMKYNFAIQEMEMQTNDVITVEPLYPEIE